MEKIQSKQVDVELCNKFQILLPAIGLSAGAELSSGWAWVHAEEHQLLRQQQHLRHRHTGHQASRFTGHQQTKYLTGHAVKYLTGHRSEYHWICEVTNHGATDQLCVSRPPRCQSCWHLGPGETSTFQVEIKQPRCVIFYMRQHLWNPVGWVGNATGHSFELGKLYGPIRRIRFTGASACLLHTWAPMITAGSGEVKKCPNWIQQVVTLSNKCWRSCELLSKKDGTNWQGWVQCVCIPLPSQGKST